MSYKFVGYWLSFEGWLGCGGGALSGTRVYRQGKQLRANWTPLVKLRWTAKNFNILDVIYDLFWMATGWHFRRGRCLRRLDDD